MLKIPKINVIPSIPTVVFVSLNYISMIIICALRVFYLGRGLMLHVVPATAVLGRWGFLLVGFCFFFSVSQQCASWIPDLR